MLKDITFGIEKGESYALLGPNGAGKTTLIRMISGLLKPSAGKIFINNMDVFEEPEGVKELIGVVSHHPFLYEDLTARENLEFYGGIYGIGEEKIDEFLKQVGLYKRGDEFVANYSRGMKQKLSIIRAIMHDPQILILDEPTTGLDVKSMNEFYPLIEGMIKEGTTILLTTHHLYEAERLCKKAAILDYGIIAAQGELDEIRSGDETLEEAYLRLTGGALG